MKVGEMRAIMSKRVKCWTERVVAICKLAKTLPVWFVSWRQIFEIC